MSEEVSMAERDYWRIQAQDTLVSLHECEARLADVMRAGDLEHARMAALIEACEAVAAFVESYAPSSNLAQTLPTFYGIFRVYGKNARAAVNACQSQADALLSELEAARAVVARFSDRTRWVSGICPACGFGHTLNGDTFHGTGCVLAAYDQACRQAREG